MGPSRINLKFSYESLNEKLCEEMIVVAGHSFLAGGCRVAVLAGVVTLVRPPYIPISVTDISIDPNIIIDIPRPEMSSNVLSFFYQICNSSSALMASQEHLQERQQ